MNKQDLFEIFPEAEKAFAAGEKWEWQPDEVDQGTFEWCDDCDEYHLVHYVMGFQIEDGEVEATFWRCDEGDLDLIDSCPIEEADETWNRDYVEPMFASHKAYSEWVIENGEDPCDEFFIKPETREQQEWSITFKRNSFKRIETNWQQLSGTMLEENVFPPDEVAGYMGFEFRSVQFESGVKAYPSTRYAWEQLIDYSQTSSRSDDVWTSTPGIRDWTITVKAKIWVTVRNSNYVEQLRAAAQKHLDSVEKPLATI